MEHRIRHRASVPISNRSHGALLLGGHPPPLKLLRARRCLSLLSFPRRRESKQFLLRIWGQTLRLSADLNQWIQGLILRHSRLSKMRSLRYNQPSWRWLVTGGKGKSAIASVGSAAAWKFTGTQNRTFSVQIDFSQLGFHILLLLFVIHLSNSIILY